MHGEFDDEFNNWFGGVRDFEVIVGEIRDLGVAWVIGVANLCMCFAPLYRFFILRVALGWLGWWRSRDDCRTAPFCTRLSRNLSLTLFCEFWPSVLVAHPLQTKGY